MLSALLHGPPVPHHIAGVLRVDEDRSNGGFPPYVTLASGVQGRGDRIPVGVGVEPLRDRAVPEALRNPPSEHLMDNRSACWVRHEAGLGATLGTTGWNGVGHLLGHVAIRRDADVPALTSVFAEAVPGLLEAFQDVPLGNSLLDPPSQDGRGFLAVEDDWLVGGKESHSCGFEIVFDLGAVISASGDSLD